MGSWSGAVPGEDSLQHFHDFAGQWQGALFSTFAQNVQLCIGQFQTFELERQNLARTQAVEQHQAHHGEIAKSAKALPKLRDLVSFPYPASASTTPSGMPRSRAR